LPAVGPWVYFFAVKAGDFTRPEATRLHLLSWLQRRPSVDELRFRVEQTPTPVNHMALAHRLMETKRHREAIPHLEAALKPEPDPCEILYWLAMCHVELEQNEQALPLLRQLLKHNPNWSNYAAWYLLIRAQAKSDDPNGALESCRQLTRLLPTLKNRCLL